MYLYYQVNRPAYTKKTLTVTQNQGPPCLLIVKVPQKLKIYKNWYIGISTEFFNMEFTL